MRFLIGVFIGVLVGVVVMSVNNVKNMVMNYTEPSAQPMNISPPLSSERIAELEHKLKGAVDIALDKAEGLLKGDRGLSSELVNTETETTLPEISNPAEDPGQIQNQEVPTKNVSATNALKTTTLQFQVVWTPFRSQTSAEGFADKLSLQLEKEFEVIRTGPGHYEVGFNFVNQPERVQVMEAINTMTGFTSEQPARERLI